MDGEGCEVHSLTSRPGRRSARLTPPHCAPPCPAGLAYIGCDFKLGCRAWIGGADWGSHQAIVHELAHNLFMHHAGWNNPNYGGAFEE